ncbi:MAG: DUF4389 domain-containing protein [Chloroflexi bacterium]|nr:DUF4389 domain-containing protein [Chloroflexota bacterium]
MRFEVDYPERLSRWKTLLRLPLLIPVWVFLYLVNGVISAALTAGWLTVFLRRRYPRWLFAATSGGLAFNARAWAYGALLTDRYPSFDRDRSPVTLEYDDPPDGHLSRWRVFFWKAALLIPHMVVLSLLAIAVVVVVVLSWFAILFTGTYPRGMFAFVVGAARWQFRVLGYFASFNDRFPPFSLSEDAGPASHTTTVICGIIGWLAAALFAVFIGFAIALSFETDDASVDYDRLVAGRATATIDYHGFAEGLTFTLTLARAYDPGDNLAPILTGGRGQHLVVFEWTLRNSSDRTVTIDPDGLKLKYQEDGETHSTSAELFVVGGIAAPAKVEDHATVTLRAVFAVPDGATPVEVRLKLPFSAAGGARFTLD